MSLSGYTVARSLLFQLDSERAHHLGLLAARTAQPFARIAGFPAADRRLGLSLLGQRFPAPVGLAAGFDKNGVAPHFWGALGFGFAELGTVTAHPQAVNPKPRMFRIPEAGAVINRLGFNNEGAAVVAARLKGSLAAPVPIPIGINVGCSRVAVGEEAAELSDIQHSVAALVSFADYLVVNVSSPNTPGLRDLQAPDRLSRLVAAAVAAAGGHTAPPVLVKLAPDLADEQLPEIVSAALEAGATGLIATNTTLARPGVAGPIAAEAGGLSGEPLRGRADTCVRLLREAAGPRVPIIGIGGISSVQDVLRRVQAGADLVSLYTGMIYHGPYLARVINRGLLREMEMRGVPDYPSLRDGLHEGTLSV